jgi:hypothetical protein
MKNIKIALWLVTNLYGVAQASDSSKSDKITLFIIRSIGDERLNQGVIEIPPSGTFADIAKIIKDKWNLRSDDHVQIIVPSRKPNPLVTDLSQRYTSSDLENGKIYIKIMKELWIWNTSRPVKNDKGETIRYEKPITILFVPKNGVVQDIIDAYRKEKNLSDADKIELFSAGNLLSPSQRYTKDDIYKFQNEYHIFSRINFKKTEAKSKSSLSSVISTQPTLQASDSPKIMVELRIRKRQPVTGLDGSIIGYKLQMTTLSVPNEGKVQDIIDAYGKAEQISDTSKVGVMFSHGILIPSSQEYHGYDLSELQKHYYYIDDRADMEQKNFVTVSGNYEFVQILIDKNIKTYANIIARYKKVCGLAGDVQIKLLAKGEELKPKDTYDAGYLDQFKDIYYAVIYSKPSLWQHLRPGKTWSDWFKQTKNQILLGIAALGGATLWLWSQQNRGGLSSLGASKITPQPKASSWFKRGY